MPASLDSREVWHHPIHSDEGGVLREDDHWFLAGFRENQFVLRANVFCISFRKTCESPATDIM